MWPMAPRRSKNGPRILVIEHEADAGPAWLGEWIAAAGVTLEVLRPYAGDAVPSRCEHDGLLVLGGAMSAGDDAVAPWLAGTRRLLGQAVADRRPTLGVCLGAQLLALAGGGSVEPGGAGPEIGVSRLEACPAAAADRLFAAVPSPSLAAQWHADTITSLPAGSVLLARGDRYEVQAFRLEEAAWGVQFHPEVDAAMVKGWAEAEHSEAYPPALLDAAVEEVAAAEPELLATWSRLGSGFGAAVTESWADAGS